MTTLPAAKRRPRGGLKYWLGGGIVLGALLYLVIGHLGDNLVFYVTPTEYFANLGRYQGHLLRLGGLVEPGTVHYDPKTQQLRFRMTDGVTQVTVRYRGGVPSMFMPDRGVVVQGRMVPGSHTFLGTQLLVKHSQNYRPPRPGQTSNYGYLLRSTQP
jgi:cytochrome c-type biogenesis protein CcmE